jgi:hypothetical protein
MIQYVYYNNTNDFFKRLELLCAERDIRNDCVEVRNEIVCILDILFKQNAILKNIINFIVNGVNNFIIR